MNALQQLGRRALDVFAAWGHGALFFMDLLRAVPAGLARFGLVVTQIHAIGNRSLVIILASGLAVGFVLALQLYNTLTNFGAAESLGLVVNLSLVRELGPVVTGHRGGAARPLVARRRAHRRWWTAHVPR
jgi:phospholipid/cholesterol/gamma-HCH transport system permease protein